MTRKSVTQKYHPLPQGKNINEKSCLVEILANLKILFFSPMKHWEGNSDITFKPNVSCYLLLWKYSSTRTVTPIDYL